jgi:TRAP-type mannitol/chloroaromatic compound transport system substrate-binding protein
MTDIKRRTFLKSGAAGAAAVAAVSAPSIVRAQETFNWRMTNAYPPGAPFYTTVPGSPEAFVTRVDELSQGRLMTEYFGAGELIPAM